MKKRQGEPTVFVLSLNHVSPIPAPQYSMQWVALTTSTSHDSSPAYKLESIVLNKEALTTIFVTSYTRFRL